MMIMAVMIICCTIGAGVSILKRARSRLALARAGFPDDAKDSPLSQALKDLLAVAGGIYLGLLMTTSFLQIDVPETIGWGSFRFEPLAAFSFLLAIIQPFISDALRSSRRYL